MCHLIIVYNVQPALPVYAIKFFLLLLSQITVNFEDRTSLSGGGGGGGRVWFPAQNNVRCEN